MPRSFSPATAEQVLSVVGAVVAKGAAADVQFIAEFCDFAEDRAEKALELSVDLGFLQKKANGYIAASPLCMFLRSPDPKQKTAILRVMLGSYEPFLVFRTAIVATGSADRAAQQTRTLLGITAHREDVKDTLVNLATYSGALTSAGGGAYQPDSSPIVDVFTKLAAGCAQQAGAESKVRDLLGGGVANTVSHPDVVVPLATGLRHAAGGDAREAVLQAGIAVENFLVSFAGKYGVPLAGAHGINSKLERLQGANRLPPKLVFKGKYLGHIRNAADHGVDADVGAAWQIRESTGHEYVWVACSLIATITLCDSGTFEI
jgi:hypothetical protein